ncbi:hypothetical protein OTC26_012810 [Streptomyces tirandamycinicus]|uniref:hypothetical protein n=1 Tax=Streptomyces tirandamycinicus TaxID=2174846 RepID=UPI002270C2F9|nr:hypothetical protein [Streptomyces tirandamycinicus]MCY0982772.1 hypothetical protein [Streptomyces tirandamycinicus]
MWTVRVRSATLGESSEWTSSGRVGVTGLVGVGVIGLVDVGVIGLVDVIGSGGAL